VKWIFPHPSQEWVKDSLISFICLYSYLFVFLNSPLFFSPPSSFENLASVFFFFRGRIEPNQNFAINLLANYIHPLFPSFFGPPANSFFLFWSQQLRLLNVVGGIV